MAPPPPQPAPLSPPLPASAPILISDDEVSSPNRTEAHASLFLGSANLDIPSPYPVSPPYFDLNSIPSPSRSPFYVSGSSSASDWDLEDVGEEKAQSDEESDWGGPIEEVLNTSPFSTTEVQNPDALYVSGSPSDSDWPNEEVNALQEGIRLAGLNSDSESECLIDFMSSLENNSGGNEMDGIEGSQVVEVSSDSDTDVEEADFDMGLVGNLIETTDDDLDWVEVINHNNEGEYMGEAMNVVFDVSSSAEDEEGILNHLELESMEDLDSDYLTFLESLPDGLYELDQDIDTNEFSFNASSPALQRAVEELPEVEIGEGNNETCAVCNEDFAEREKVRMMPCGHYYHGECIIPWLRIRNTCPVCRFELPTTDEEYERSRRRRSRRTRRRRMN